jgi:hypothetical protein
MIDVFTIAFAVVVLVAVARWNRPVRSITAFFLALLTGAWIWANLRDSGWQEVWNEDAPEGVDPITRTMFWRGWPIAPFMLCLIHGNRFRSGGGEGLALVFDWLVLFLVLSLARFVCERCSLRRNRRAVGDITRRLRSRPPPAHVPPDLRHAAGPLHVDRALLPGSSYDSTSSIFNFTSGDTPKGVDGSRI